MTRSRMTLTLGRLGRCPMLLMVAGSALAQPVRAPTGLGRAGSDTERYGASAAAATRAIDGGYGGNTWGVIVNSGLYGEGNGSPQADIYSNGATVEGRAVTNILPSCSGRSG
jgi:hypothetical protein